MAPGESVTALASRIHWEQLQLRQNYFQSPTGRRYSPGAVPGTEIFLIYEHHKKKQFRIILFP